MANLASSWRAVNDKVSTGTLITANELERTKNGGNLCQFEGYERRVFVVPIMRA